MTQDLFPYLLLVPYEIIHIISGTGFLPEVTEQLIKEAKIDSLKPHEKHVALCFDEVRIKDNLVYDKHGLQVIAGLCRYRQY